MMEYRKLPHGKEEISVLGLGMGGIQAAPPSEISKPLPVFPRSFVSTARTSGFM